MENAREVVLDTETTGLSVRGGHKVIEIGCVELIRKNITGKTFHAYLNPKRKVDESAFAIHGISDAFLADKPCFSYIAHDFLHFIGKSRLVIHNAAFDMQFINQELSILGLPIITVDRVVDTLHLARRKFPGAQASLDALCKRFRISLHAREKHGALIDSELLALVYIQLAGQEQTIIDLDGAKDHHYKRKRYDRRYFICSDEEKELHDEFMAQIKNPIWQ